MFQSYLTDVKAALRLSDRNSKGQFVKGNKYRFSHHTVNVAGKPCSFLMQSPLVGDFCKAVKMGGVQNAR